MAWTYDAPSGVYKNHSLSDRIRKQAVARTVFMPFLTIERGFGRKQGESHTITRMLRLPLAGRVSETDRLPYGRPPIETKTIGISEWGYAVPLTDFEEKLSKFDIMNNVQSALRQQIELTLDVMAAQSLKLTPIKYVPQASGFTLSTNNVAGATSDRNLSVQDLREMHDYLSGELKVPPYANGKYVGILSTRAARGIMNDPEYKDWLQPTTSEPLMNGMLKDIEGFRLIVSNNYGYETDALDNLVGASTTTGEAIFFGADAAGMLQITAPELRVGQPYDFGRFRDVGWYGIFEGFHVWDRASLARAIHVTSL